MPSDSAHPNNRLAMAFALLPGLSQVYLDHVLLGALFFAGFLTSLNGIFLAANLQSANTHVIGRVAIVALVLVWVGSAWHAYALSYGTDRSGLARDRGQLLRMALLDYLRDDLDAAALKLERAIDLDIDWQDPDPLFHLGVVMLRIAEVRALSADTEGTRTARRRSQWAFRTCLGRDRFGKWRREIRRETKRMRSLLTQTGRLSMTQSERLLRSDTTLLGFPELRESGAMHRPISGSRPAPGASGSASQEFPRTRVTPRPFDRRKLANALKDDTTVKVKPPADGDYASLDDETRASAPLAGAEAAAEERSVPEGAEGDPAQTQPAARPLPGDSGSAAEGLEDTRRDGRGSTELPGEAAPPPEDGLPATRLDVRPEELIADLLPRTRQAVKRAETSSEFGPPPTRLAARPRRADLGEVPPTRSSARPEQGAQQDGDDEEDGEELPEIVLGPADLSSSDPEAAAGAEGRPPPTRANSRKSLQESLGAESPPPTRANSRKSLQESLGAESPPPTRVNSREALQALRENEATPLEISYRGLRLDVSTRRAARPEAADSEEEPQSSPEDEGHAEGGAEAEAPRAVPAPEEAPATLEPGAPGGEAPRPAPEEASSGGPADQEGT